MYFNTNLPESLLYEKRHDKIFVVIGKLFKVIYHITCRSNMIAPQLAEIIMQRLIVAILSDRR